MSTGQGSALNVRLAICSLLIPGLGQLVQKRMPIAAVMFVLACVLWIVRMGWVIHVWSSLDAAMYKARN